jgi:hypothetical protein
MLEYDFFRMFYGWWMMDMLVGPSCWGNPGNPKKGYTSEFYVQMLIGGWGPKVSLTRGSMKLAGSQSRIPSSKLTVCYLKWP